MSEHSKKVLLRLGLIIFELFFFGIILFILLFFVFRSIPGNIGSVGQGTTPEQIAARRAALGLDFPLNIQFEIYIRNFFTLGTFGQSFVDSPGRPVEGFIFERFLVSIQFALPAVVVAIIIGATLGIVAGNNSGRFLDSMLSIINGFLISVPAVILAIFFRYLGTINFGQTLPALYSGNRPFESLILPFFTIFFVSIGANFFLVRTAVINETKEQYITFAKAKGVSKFRIASVHSIKQVLYPVATIAPLSLFATIAGAVFTESIFNIPGAGRGLITSISQNDYNVAFALTFISSMALVASYGFRDILYLVLDPRVRRA